MSAEQLQLDLPINECSACGAKLAKAATHLKGAGWVFGWDCRACVAAERCWWSDRDGGDGGPYAVDEIFATPDEWIAAGFFVI